MTDLEPISPRDALDMYLQDVDGELSPNSVQQKEYQLGFFVRWCEGTDADGPRIENLNNLSGRDLTRFKNWRGENIGKVTLKTNLSAVRSFLRFCVKIDAVGHNLPDKVNVPTLNRGENERETLVETNEASDILDYLSTFEYASFDHVLFLLQWTTGMRMSGLHSLDVGDVNREEATLRVVHRPDHGTRLKNKQDGERVIALSASVVETVGDYIDHNRIDSTDEYGRKPLFATRYGRMHKNQMNKHIYSVTRPCAVDKECPSGKDPSECDYTGGYDANLKCPHNNRPHDVRRGSITAALRDEVPEKAVSDRMNVSIKTLDRHYDSRSEEEKAEMRREHFEDR
jgi:integrase